MEEEGDGEELGTPFWLQNTSNLRHADRLRRRVSSVFFSSGLLVFLLLVMAAFFLVFVVPSSLSFSAQIFRPNSIKKSWDSLNIVLVLVAVVFGFLSKIKNEDRNSSYYDEFQASPYKQKESQKSNPSTPSRWYNYNTIEGQKHSNPSNANLWYEHYSDYQIKMEHKNSVLKRNSSSYPDLRQIESNGWDYGDYHRRYYDDIHVEAGRVQDAGQHHRRHRSMESVDFLTEPPHSKAIPIDTLGEVGWAADSGRIHRRHRSLEEVDGLRVLGSTKAIFVDTLGNYSKESTSSQPSESAQPTAAAAAEPPVEYEEKSKTRSYESVAQKKERSSRRLYKDYEYMNPITEAKPPLSSLSTQPPELLVGESPGIQEKPMRSNESESHRRKTSRRKQNTASEPMNPVTAPESAPPTPPPPQQQQQQEKNSKSERERGGTSGSATKDFLNSLYHKKKKKPRQKSGDNLDSLLHQAEAPLSFQIPPPSSPPPPPPPPPPPSVFQNLFSSKKHKRKRHITVPVATTEPQQESVSPPSVVTRESNTTSQTAPITNQKPPKPVKMNSSKFDEISNSGGESPLNRIPPPPPPPPPGFLKNTAWKFVVQGDYVRIDSTTTSRSGSPERDSVDSDATPSAQGGGGGTPFHPSPSFCPSPDVNTKAESFISNFRAKLKLEKIHSMNKRELGLSGLGPNLGPSRI